MMVNGANFRSLKSTNRAAFMKLKRISDFSMACLIRCIITQARTYALCFTGFKISEWISVPGNCPVP